jgi:AcrR family transcriptional regulator
MVTKQHLRNKDCVDNHELILDSAAELLKEVGYKKMTIDELARHAGLGKGTVYLYFESKQEVALSFIDRQNSKLQSYLREILRSKDRSRNRLREMLVQRVMYRFQCVQGHKQGIDDLLIDLRPQLLERRARYLANEAKIFAEVLIEGRTTGEFMLEEPFRVAEAFLDATNSLLPHSLSPTQLGERNQLLDRASFLADLLVKSVEVRHDLRTNPTDITKNSRRLTRLQIESEVK